MPSLEENKKKWDGTYHWTGGGDNWSAPWGSVDMQWHASLWPRVRRFVPCETILEIATGYGRWTEFLKDHCRRLIGIDLSQRCVEACRQRFADQPHLEFHVNDGLSLDAVPDGSIDLAFSFDSLVHAEADVVASYLRQLARKLRPDGVAFLHHSNAGAYRGYFRAVRSVGPLRAALRLARLETKTHGRALSVSANAFTRMARDAGLNCPAQELINWRSSLLVDCITTVVHPGSRHDAEPRVVRNRGFMGEAAAIARIAPIYAVRRAALIPA